MRKHKYISRRGSEPWGSQQMPVRSDRGPQEDPMHLQTSPLQGPSTLLTANIPSRPKASPDPGASPPRLAGTDWTQGDSSWRWLGDIRWGQGLRAVVSGCGMGALSCVWVGRGGDHRAPGSLPLLGSSMSSPTH